DGIRDFHVTGVQTCALPISARPPGPRPGVLAARVEARPGEVEPGAAPVLGEHLRLQPGEQPQALRVALEAAAGRGELVEHDLAEIGSAPRRARTRSAGGGRA